MNLGDASLRFVNSKQTHRVRCSTQLTPFDVIASRPQLIHTASKQSVTVSDDYYSLGSDESNTDDRTTVLRYQTPPSQMRSPDASRDALQSEATVPTIRPVAHEPPASNTKQSAVSFGDGEVMKSRPGTANSSTVQKFTNSEVSPPTPGVDDTPYIRFAIDQLTRDEELLGRRRQEVTSDESYPIGTIDRVEDTSRKSTGHERQPSDLEIKRPDTPGKYGVFQEQLDLLTFQYSNPQCFDACRSRRRFSAIPEAQFRTSTASNPFHCGPYLLLLPHDGGFDSLQRLVLTTSWPTCLRRCSY